MLVVSVVTVMLPDSVDKPYLVFTHFSCWHHFAHPGCSNRAYKQSSWLKNGNVGAEGAQTSSL